VEKKVMKMSKGYNPFKMWGSYVGLVAGLIYGIFGVLTYIGEGMTSGVTNNIFTFTVYILIELFPTLSGMTGFITWVIINSTLTMVIGFLLGWAIHSLVRKLT
jgi:hypothetical protein